MQSTHENVPEEYLCPIFHTIMEDPVITIDGYTFEKKAIQEWFSKGNVTNPLTGISLPNQCITPVRSLRSLIEKFVSQDMKNGFHIEYWSDGGRFEGNFANGKREGYGT